MQGSRSIETRGGGRLTFTPLGLGTAPLGDLFTKLGDAASHATVAAAYQAGIRMFDTSPHYGNGLAEARLGGVLRDLPRDSFVLSTKVGRWMDPFTAPEAPSGDVVSPGFAGGFPHRARFDYSYDGTMRSIEQSLLRTGLSRFDILLIHDCDVWTHGATMVDQRFAEAMEGAYRALDRLRADGTVAAIGLGVNEADMCERFARAGDFDVMMLAGRYSLLEQPALRSFLPLAVEKKIGILLAGVFNSGILATGAVPGAKYNYVDAPPEVLARVGRIEAVCSAHGVTIRQAALAFALAHPAVMTLVLGAVKPAEIEANVADVAVAVPAALWSDLKAQGLLDAGRQPVDEGTLFEGARAPMMFRRSALAIGLLFAVLASQLPEFAQQYRQRLGGAIDELNAIITQFDEEATALSLTREQAINRLKSNDDVLAQERGQSVADSVNRKDRLVRQRQELQTAGPVRQYEILALYLDPGIAQQAYGDYEPALPVTVDGFVSAGIGLVIGWLLTHLVTFPIRHRRPHLPGRAVRNDIA